MGKFIVSRRFSYGRKIREVPDRDKLQGPERINGGYKKGHLYLKSIFVCWITIITGWWTKKAKEGAVHKRSSYYSSAEAAVSSEEILENIDPYDRITVFEDFLENKFNIDRELFQREVHRYCVAVLAHLIVGKEWKFIGKNIVDQRGWAQLILSLSFFAMAYRRAGKTSAIQILAATALILICAISIAVFSSGKRISQVFGKGIIKMVIQAGYEDMLYRNADENIELRIGNNANSERSLFMSPGNPDIYILLLFAHWH